MQKLGVTIERFPNVHVVRVVLLALCLSLGASGIALMAAPAWVLSAVHAFAAPLDAEYASFIGRAFGSVAISVAYLCAKMRSLRDCDLATLFGGDFGTAPKSL